MKLDFEATNFAATISWTFDMIIALSFSMLTLKDIILIDAMCAVMVHIIYKKRDLAAATLFHTVALLGIVPCFPAYLFQQHFSLISTIIISFGIFYSTLIGSILLYRLSPFHPLAKYPGPPLAIVSKLWGAYISSQGKSQNYLKDLHAEYGQYVRIGPNELSVTDINVVPDILGANGMPKGPRWDGWRGRDKNAVNLISTRNLHDHARRRKAWDRALNTTGIKDFEPVLTRRVSQLADELKKRSNNKESDNIISVNLAEWFRFFAFDFMGDMAFGGGFETMREGVDNSGYWSLHEANARVSTVIPHLPWAASFIHMLPRLTDKTERFRKFGREAARRRKLNGSNVKDLFYHLIDEAGLEKNPPTDQEVFYNGSLAVIAGSETTSTVLSELFFFLLSHPVYYKRLQAEVDTAFPRDEGSPFDASKLTTGMPFLNAVINETLRLGPPVATTLQRAPAKGSGGHWIGNSFLPEGTAVIVPPYVMARDPKYFSPFTEEFIPERWLGLELDKCTVKPTEETMRSDGPYANVIFKTEVAAFNPFSFGPANCVGRGLALMEIRMVVATLIQCFEMHLADGYDRAEWEEKLKDWFLLMTGPLPVVLTSRTYEATDLQL